MTATKTLVRLLGLGVLVATGGCAGGWRAMKTTHITGYSETPRYFRRELPR